MKKYFIWIMIILLAGLTALTVNRMNRSSHYVTPPETAMNRAVWLAELRASDALQKAVESRVWREEELGPLLTLAGSLQEQFRGMVGEGRYPRFGRDNVLHGYSLQVSPGGGPQGTEWDRAAELAQAYKEAVKLQAELFNDQGKQNEQVLADLMRVDERIREFIPDPANP